MTVRHARASGAAPAAAAKGAGCRPPAQRLKAPDCTPCSAERNTTKASFACSHMSANHRPSVASAKPNAQTSNMAGVVTHRDQRRARCDTGRAADDMRPDAGNNLG